MPRRRTRDELNFRFIPQVEKKNVKVVNFEEQSRKIYFALRDEEEAYNASREAAKEEKKVR
jgi:hypothetical protein